MRLNKIAAVLTATVFIGCGFSAQAQIFGISKKCKYSNTIFLSASHRNIRPYKQMSVNVSYEDSSTLLTVDFPFNTEGGTVEVFCDGSKVAGITTGGGTMFSCTLQDYGIGIYNIIVSNKKTVVYTKNVVISK